MRRILIFTVSALALILPACSRAPGAEQAARPEAESPGASYTCPMHPHYISTDPDGSCPICGMDLVAAAGSALQDAATGERAVLYYKNPMGQADTSPVPKKDWMGMDYIPVYADAPSGPGFSVAPETLQTMGVRTEAASRRPLGRALRAFGTVETNERLEAVSVSRLEGWIENLRVRAEGDAVKPGALLYDIYSPDLIAAQKDFLNSLEIGNPKRIASVRQRLRSLGMQPGVIARIEKDRSLIERVPVYAEDGGLVTELTVREGDYVTAGSPVLRLQSYSDVWIMAQIPEGDLPLVRTGLAVTLSFPSAPDVASDGKIAFIYPEIDSRTRTARVRIEVENAAGLLRPGAYADIRMDLGGEPRLTVPTEAVLRDSAGARVVISLGEGRFESRDVRTGAAAGGHTEIIAGLNEGELVVASGQFLLDSEASLREGLAKMQAPQGVAADMSTPFADLALDAATLAELDHFTDAALYLHEALTEGYEPRADFFAPALLLGERLSSRFAGTRLSGVLAGATQALKAAQAAPDTDGQRAALAELSAALAPWWLNGAPAHYKQSGLALFRETTSDRLWIQTAGAPLNPFGSSKSEAVAWPDPMAEMQP